MRGDAAFRFVAVVHCSLCGELVADVMLAQVYADDVDEPVEPETWVPVVRRKLRHPDADRIIGLNNGTRRLTRCPCKVQPCEKPEHLYTGQRPQRRVEPDDYASDLLSDLGRDWTEVWCSTDGDQRVDLRAVRARIPYVPPPTTAKPISLRTVHHRRSTRR